MDIEKPFIFLCKLAWESRYRIPIIISVFFMVFDIRMQVDINIQMRTIQRRAHRRIEENDDDDEDDDSDDSWMTIDETEENGNNAAEASC